MENTPGTLSPRTPRTSRTPRLARTSLAQPAPRPVRRLVALVAAPLLAVALFVGCSAPTSIPGSAAETGGQTDAAQTAPGYAPGEAPGAVPTDPGAAVTQDGPQLQRTASAVVEVPDVLAAADAARALGLSLDGWVVDESIRLSEADGDVGRAARASTITLSVPSARLDEALGRLDELGKVVTRSSVSKDVTKTVTDTNTRIRNLEASITRIEALMERAGSLSEVAGVERELSQRLTELETMRATQQGLAASVERATLNLTLRTPGATAPAPPPFVDGLRAGWEAFLASLVVIWTVLGALLPFALVGALVGGPVVWWWRRRVAARAAQTGDAPAGREPGAGSSAG